jgi:hypothetical protein
MRYATKIPEEELKEPGKGKTGGCQGGHELSRIHHKGGVPAGEPKENQTHEG